MFRKKITGFTLIEILIAVFIFAIIAVIATSILFSVFNAQEITKSRMREINAIQISTILLKRDLSQIVNRPVRAANSNIIPAIVAQTNYLEFTRSGNPNPFGMLQQSNLQRVVYQIKNGELIRETWPRLDRVSSTAPDTRVLLKNVISGNFSYLGTGATFYQNWPPGVLLKNNSLNGEPIPRAIALNLQLKNWGDFYLIVAIPSTQL